jgi:hypothetical protein
MNDIELLRKEFEEHIEVDAKNFEEIKKMFDTINAKLDPILDVYRSVILSKSFIMGLAGVIVAIGAITTGVIWLINSAVNK